MLDETEGSIAHDSAGEHHDATLEGNPLWQPVDGAVDGALAFDGVDDRVKTPFVVDPAIRPFSVLAWVKGGAPGQVIISQIDGADWLLADPANGTLMTTISPPPSRTPIPPLTSDYVITDNHWHHIGLVYDDTDRILYADGIEVARDTQDSPQESSEGLYIGCGNERQNGTFWSGLIDDVRIYNRVVRP